MGAHEPTEVKAPPRAGDEGERLSAVVQYVAEIDHEGKIIAVSQSARAQSASEIIGTRIQRWLVPVVPGSLERAIASAFSAGETSLFASVGRDTGRLFESQITPVWCDDKTVRAVVTTQDVTDRQREQLALRESEQRFHALVHGAFEGLAITVEGKMLVANDALGRILGASAESLVGRSGYEFAAPESIATALEAVRSGNETPYEVVGIRADGSRYPCEILGRNIMYLGQPARLTGFRDLTDRRRLERERQEIEEQMRQAQKLESLGVLAGGIAHDFNNVLMAVLANSELAAGLPETSAAGAERLAAIQSAAMRGRELTRQLLNYAAQGPLTSQPVDLNELVRDTVALIGVSISKKAELSLQLAPEPAVVDGDPGQLAQSIMNLVINGSEALADAGGRIEIHIAPMQVMPGDLEGSPLIADIPSGRAIMLRVRDSGQGMSEETRKRIYEPFFTTKVTGRGLGLASVLNVVRGHRGAIRVRSEPGSGSEFTVWFRRSDEQPAPHVAPEDGQSVQASRGLALVADDEPLLRHSTRDALAVLGFDVVLAEDGERALQQFEAHAEQLALVVLDLTMPKLSGVEVLRRIRARRKDVPVLCVSGYSAELVASEFGSDPAARFLAKPYAFTELSAIIDTLLGA